MHRHRHYVLVGHPSIADGLDDYYLLHASRASMLERMGRLDDAERAYARAADLAHTEAESRFLAVRREALARAGRRNGPGAFSRDRQH